MKLTAQQWSCLRLPVGVPVIAEHLAATVVPAASASSQSLLTPPPSLLPARLQLQGLAASPRARSCDEGAVRLRSLGGPAAPAAAGPAGGEPPALHIRSACMQVLLVILQGSWDCRWKSLVQQDAWVAAGFTTAQSGNQAALLPSLALLQHTHGHHTHPERPEAGARTAALEPGGEVTRRFFAPNPVVLQASGAGWERRPDIPDDILGMIAVMMALLSRSSRSQNPLASRLPTSPTLLACCKVPPSLRPCPPPRWAPRCLPTAACCGTMWTMAWSA